MGRRVNHVHVTKRLDGWVVRHNKKQKGVYPTQKESISAGRKIAQAYKAELVIHGKDGKIRKKHSFGNDPRSIRG